MQKRTVAFHTIGCKLNYSETSTLSRYLETEGFVKKEFEEEADIYVINTCSVTENANKECKQLIRKIQRKTPESFIVVTGCYAQLKPKEIAEIQGVDLVLGAQEKFNIAAHIKELTKNVSGRISGCEISEVKDFHSTFSFNDRTRAFLKVQDGCDYNCSFCTIPQARGISRSDTIKNVINNAQLLGKKGIKEIVLTGINLGDFGKEIPGEKNQESFYELITELEQLKEIERIRISSIEPNLLTQEIIEFVGKSKKFMPHFHIPLQSGSNYILGLMRRRYKKELYRDKVEMIKSIIPYCAIGADVIVGFPSESHSHFQETFDFLHLLDISYLHVFTYSERDNTKAIDIKPVVPVNVRQERNKILRNLSYKKAQYFNECNLGMTRKVLFEISGKKGIMEGYTDNYIRVQTPYREEWVNQIVDWKIL